MRKLTIGILAHVDAGKTTLSECLLYTAGAIRVQGRVDHKNTVFDNYEVERRRGITVFSKLATFTCDQTEVTLVDTPGHVDFSAEMERTLEVLDAAILVVSSASGVQGHTKTLAGLLNNKKIPVFVFVNKTDMPGLSPETIMSSLSSLLCSNPVRFDKREEDFCENVAMSEETLLDRYINGHEIEDEDISRLIKNNMLSPVFFGSALKGKGVKELLDCILEYAPVCETDTDFGGRVYKISRDDKGVRLSFVKITGGCLNVKDVLTHRDGRSEKIEQIRLYNGSNYTSVNQAQAGGIYAFAGLNFTYSGEGLGVIEDAPKAQIIPVFTYRVSAPDLGDDKILFKNLKLLEDEDPSLHVQYNEKLDEIHISLMGDMMLEILSGIYKSRFGHDIICLPAGIVYKETIKTTTVGVGHFEPLRHYAEVHLLISPLPAGSGIVIDSMLSVDVMPEHFQKQVLNALNNKIHAGVLTGFALTDVHISLIAGRTHEKHTESGDFREATWRAVRQGLMKTKNVLLEPVLEFEIKVPQGNVGRAMTDINKLHGVINESLSKGDFGILTGSAPAALIHDYQKEINVYTSGQGSISLKLSGYMPCHNETEVLENTNYDPVSDLYNTPDSVFCSHGAGINVPWEEVDEHCHVKAYAYSHLYMDHKTEQAKTESIKTERRNSSVDELEEIFTRTYGQSKRDRYNYNEPKVIEAPKNPVLKEYKPNNHTDKRTELMIIDGYNVIHADKELSALNSISQDAAREKLIDILENYQGFTGKHILAVFDAYNVKQSRKINSSPNGLEIVFSPAGQTADMFIESYVHDNINKKKITVVTSDGLVQLHILSQGAIRMSSAELLMNIAKTNSEISEKVGD